MRKLRIGIVGCGGIANQKHFPALEANQELCEMVAFCDLIEERAQKAAQEHGAAEARVYTDYHDLANDDRVDVIHICTPNVAHCEVACCGFEAGKHILCEKPMAASTEDAEKMMEAWKKSGKKFTIGYQNRFRPDVQMLKQVCEEGELGEIYYGKAHAVRRRAVPTWGVFPDKSKQGGGPLIDIGTHALDITLWCMDNYKPVSVDGSVFYKLGHLKQATEGNLFGPWDTEAYEVEDSAMGFIKMEDGSCIHLEASWALNILESKEASTTLCGTKAGAEIHSGMSYPSTELILNRGHAGQLTEETITKSGNIAYFAGGNSSADGAVEAKQWLEAILNDKEPCVRPEQAFVVTQILDAIYHSAQTGEVVKFNRMKQLSSTTELRRVQSHIE